MALVLNDRVKETSTTTGTGTFSLGGAVDGFESFVTGIANGNTTYYAAVNRDANEFEVGIGTVTDASPDTLVRTTILSSSNSDSAVDFSAGTKDIFVTLPASKVAFEDASNDVTIGNDLILGSDSAVLKFGADSDTTLTHTDGTGLTLNSTNKLLFRDTGLYINSSTDGQLDLVADTEIQIAATTIDINGNVEISGDLTVSGDDITMGTNTAGNILVADGTNFNSIAATDLSAISTIASGDTLLAVDASGGGLKKVARSVLVAGLATSSALNNVSEDTSPQLGGNLDMNGSDIVTTSNATIDLAPNGTGTVVVRGNTNSGAIVFNCESNSHGQKVIAQPHSAGVTNVMLLPAGADSTLVSLVSTDTLTNKTLTSPKINEDVAVTSTATELNVLDGITAVVGELNALDIGATAIGTAVASKAVILDANKDYTGFRNITLSGELDAGSLDVSGDADIDGTLEADAITVAGVALATFVRDTVGTNMLSSNTESGIAVTYDTTNDNIDFAINAAQTGITSLLATDIKIGEDDQTKIDFETADEIHFYAANVEQVYLGDNIFGPQSDSDVDLGSTGVRWKDAFVDSITVTGEIDGASLDISGNADIDGTLETDALSIASTTVTSTAAELNILDGVTSTAAELNYSDLATLGTTAASKVFTADANGLTKVSGAVLNTEDTLTDGSTIAWDVIASPVAKVTLGGNRTFAAPSGTTPAAGQFVSLLLIQDGTGSRTITWNAVYEFAADTAPTLTTTANLGDLFVFRYNGAKWLEVGRNLALTLS